MYVNKKHAVTGYEQTGDATPMLCQKSFPDACKVLESYVEPHELEAKPQTKFSKPQLQSKACAMYLDTFYGHHFKIYVRIF